MQYSANLPNSFSCFLVLGFGKANIYFILSRLIKSCSLILGDLSISLVFDGIQDFILKYSIPLKLIVVINKLYPPWKLAYLLNSEENSLHSATRWIY